MNEVFHCALIFLAGMGFGGGLGCVATFAIVEKDNRKLHALVKAMRVVRASVEQKVLIGERDARRLRANLANRELIRASVRKQFNGSAP